MSWQLRCHITLLFSDTAMFSSFAAIYYYASACWFYLLIIAAIATIAALIHFRHIDAIQRYDTPLPLLRLRFAAIALIITGWLASAAAIDTPLRHAATIHCQMLPRWCLMLPRCPWYASPHDAMLLPAVLPHSPDAAASCRCRHCWRCHERRWARCYSPLMLMPCRCFSIAAMPPLAAMPLHSWHD